MLQGFTKNYHDNSTDAGFQFTFYCDTCNDGYKTSFIESETYKKKKGTRLFGRTVGIAGGLFRGRASSAAHAADQGSSVMSERFEGQSPEWHKEHEQASERAQNEARPHFHRCPNCNSYACDHCWNEDTGLCTRCSPRQEVYVAKASAGAMKRNIDEKAATAVVWDGKIESKTTICPQCGKPAGSGKFCNNCGASMDMKECPKCGAKNAVGIRFCNNCGENLEQTAAPPNGACSACGTENPPGTKFCGSCGNKL